MAPDHEAAPRAAFYDHESEQPRRRLRPAADWGVGEDIFDRMPSRRFKRGDRRADHHDVSSTRRGEDQPPRQTDGEDFEGHMLLDARPLVPGESRTIVLGTEETRADEPTPRKTVVISGHPDRLPARQARPPRTAVERIGASPDRIAGYAVALGFLLVLIAVLTTGQ